MVRSVPPVGVQFHWYDCAMPSSLLGLLREVPDVTLHPCASREELDALRRETRVRMPLEHEDLLAESNGIEAYAGYVRLFGVNVWDRIDLAKWNHIESWKFAWKGCCDGFWCFGGTAWGDQYAYPLDAHGLIDSTAVYFLEAYSMTPEVIAGSFREFFHDEFVRVATNPYDQTLIDARATFGQLDAMSHIVQTPPLALSRSSDTGAIHAMDARAAMVCLGDVATQIEAMPDGAEVQEFQMYEDVQKRARIRLIWE